MVLQRRPSVGPGAFILVVLVRSRQSVQHRHPAMAFGGLDLASLPKASGGFLGGLAAVPRPSVALAAGGGTAAPTHPGLCEQVLVDSSTDSAWRLPLCWHGERCPWHVRGCCWWRHAPLSLPAAPSGLCTPVKDLAASVVGLEGQLGTAAAQVSALTEELRGLDTQISAAFAVEIVELSQDAEAKHLQLESLLGLSGERIKAQLLAFKQQLDALPVVNVEAISKQCTEAVINHFGSLLSGLQERIKLDVMVLRGRLADLEQGTRMTTAGGFEPLCGPNPCDGGSQSLATSLSACVNDDDVAGGSGFQGGGGGGGDDVEGGCSLLSRPQSVHSGPRPVGDWNAALSMLPAAELARRFALLPAHLKEDCAGSAEACKAIAAMLPF